MKTTIIRCSSVIFSFVSHRFIQRSQNVTYVDLHCFKLADEAELAFTRLIIPGVIVVGKKIHARVVPEQTVGLSRVPVNVGHRVLFVGVGIFVVDFPDKMFICLVRIVKLPRCPQIVPD